MTDHRDERTGPRSGRRRLAAILLAIAAAGGAAPADAVTVSYRFDATMTAESAGPAAGLASLHPATTVWTGRFEQIGVGGTVVGGIRFADPAAFLPGAGGVAGLDSFSCTLGGIACMGHVAGLEVTQWERGSGRLAFSAFNSDERVTGVLDPVAGLGWLSVIGETLENSGASSYTAEFSLAGTSAGIAEAPLPGGVWLLASALGAAVLLRRRARAVPAGTRR